MPGLTGSLEVARNTLLNTQTQIQTATHNIANADNPAYARQKAQQVSNPATYVHGGWLGNGARIETITQVRDTYIERRLMDSVSQEAGNRSLSSFLSTIGSTLLDNGDVGLSQDLGAFWNGWDALSQNPDGTVQRDGVVSAAKSLAQTLRSSSEALTSLGEQIQQQTSDTVDQINTGLGRIAKYNTEIMKMEASGHPANDLRDLRYQAVKDLSALVHVDTQENDYGGLTVTVTDGTTSIELVSDQTAGALQYDPTTQQLSYTDTTGNTIGPGTNDPGGGSLTGQLKAYDKVNEYKGRLDTFAVSLITQVNTAHGTQPVFDGDDAASITLDPGFTSESVNGLEASNIADLQHVKAPELANSDLGEYLSGIQQQIGLDQQDALSRADFQQALSSELETQQQSVSGVSIDEELVDLIKFQQVYQAAAKVVSVTSDLLKTTIDMV